MKAVTPMYVYPVSAEHRCRTSRGEVIVRDFLITPTGCRLARTG
jgi:hypothetical protein